MCINIKIKKTKNFWCLWQICPADKMEKENGFLKSVEYCKLSY